MPPAIPCEEYTNQETCVGAGCYWYDGTCHGTPPPVIPCSNYTNQEDCEGAGCYWYDGSCHGTPQPPPTGWNDDFNDNNLDLTKWTPSASSGCSVTETNQRLEMDVPVAGSGEVDTKTSHDVSGKTITVDIGTISGVIGDTRLALSDMADPQNTYVVQIKRPVNQVIFQRHKALDSGWKYVASITPIPSGITKLRFRMTGGVIYAEYYDGTWHEVGHENWALPSTTMFLYLLIQGISPTYYGKGYFDNLVEA